MTSIEARHDAQKSAGERLGARRHPDGAFDLVLDCAGTVESFAQAVHLCGPGATLLMLATWWHCLTLPAMEVCMKELHLWAASMYCRQGLTRNINVAASLLASNPHIADCIISHRLPLDAAAEAFATAANRRAGALKVVLQP